MSEAAIEGPAPTAMREIPHQQPPKPRRGGRLTETRKQDIVRRAARLFLERGYEQVSIDDIVAEIGGSKRTLYARFGGKAGLFGTVIESYCAAVDRDLEAGVSASQPLEEQLVRIGTNFLGTILDPKILELHRLMVSMGKKFPSVAQMFFRLGPSSAYSIAANWIRRQQKNGAIIPGDPDQLAALFLDMLTGHFQLALLTSTAAAISDEAIERAVRLGANVFLRGAAAASPASAKKTSRGRS